MQAVTVKADPLKEQITGKLVYLKTDGWLRHGGTTFASNTTFTKKKAWNQDPIDLEKQKEHKKGHDRRDQDQPAEMRNQAENRLEVVVNSGLAMQNVLEKLHTFEEDEGRDRNGEGDKRAHEKDGQEDREEDEGIDLHCTGRRLFHL